MTVAAHPTLLRRGFLLCSDSADAVAIGTDGICPVHRDGACAIWYVPWADVDPRRSANKPTTRERS